jgi:hypothetical protein
MFQKQPVRPMAKVRVLKSMCCSPCVARFVLGV